MNVGFKLRGSGFRDEFVGFKLRGLSFWALQR